MIDVDFLKTCMKNVLSDTRYLHSMGVYEVAIDMAWPISMAVTWRRPV